MTALFFFSSPSFAQSEVEYSTATGNTITFDNATGVAEVEGDAVVHDSTATLKADKIRIDTKTKKGYAEGNVFLEQPSSSSTLKGTDADFSWEAGTGTIHGAEGENPPWRFSAEEMRQVSPDIYFLKDGSVTTCDLDPPHYHIFSHRGKIRRGKRVTLYNARLIPDETPSFWLPIYTHSLLPKKYRLRIQPGHTGRDGYITKTILGYPFSKNTWTNFRWDYLQRTGNGAGLEHLYNAPNIRGRFDSYYIRDSNPDPQPRSKEYSIAWDHYQRLTSKLSLNSKVNFKTTQSFGNQYSDVGNLGLIENKTRGLISAAGLAYQFSQATLQAQFERNDKFDNTISSRQFISHLLLPRILFNTAPLKTKSIPFYTSFSGSYTNDTLDRSTPLQTLRYKKNAVTAVEIKRDVRVQKKTTLTPLLGYSQSWDDRLLTSTGVVTEKDQYVGRYTVGMDLRRRLFRTIDARTGYRYIVRNRRNQTLQDVAATDYGVETNQLLYSVQSRLGRSSLLTLSSGYDYRADPRDQPGKYRRVSARVISPSMDLQWEVKPDVNVFFRETYSIYDTRTKTPIRTPVNTSGEVQFGKTSAPVYFSHGFSYSKKGFGEKSELFLNNTVRFFLTPKWYADVLVNYRVVGESRLDYRKAFPIQKTLRLVRDLHCWILRAEFSSRPGVNEASFYIDMKANATLTKNVFAKDHSSIYSMRNDGPDLSRVFPEPKPTPVPTPPSTK